MLFSIQHFRYFIRSGSEKSSFCDFYRRKFEFTLKPFIGYAAKPLMPYKEEISWQDIL